MHKGADRTAPVHFECITTGITRAETLNGDL